VSDTLASMSIHPRLSPAAHSSMGMGSGIGEGLMKRGHPGSPTNMASPGAFKWRVHAPPPSLFLSCARICGLFAAKQGFSCIQAHDPISGCLSTTYLLKCISQGSIRPLKRGEPRDTAHRINAQLNHSKAQHCARYT